MFVIVTRSLSCQCWHLFAREKTLIFWNRHTNKNATGYHIIFRLNFDVGYADGALAVGSVWAHFSQQKVVVWLTSPVVAERPFPPEWQFVPGWQFVTAWPFAPKLFLRLESLFVLEKRFVPGWPFAAALLFAILACVPDGLFAAE